MRLKFSPQVFEKCSHIKFHENPFGGIRDFPCWRTDRRTNRHDETNSCFSQFCKVLKNAHFISRFCGFLWYKREKPASVVTFPKLFLLRVSIGSIYFTVPLSHMLILMMGPSWLGPILVCLEGACPIVGGWRAWRRRREVESPQSHSAERRPAPRNLLQLDQVLWLQALGGRAGEGETAARIHGNACLLHHKMAAPRHDRKETTHSFT
jgi:hypothetical protein